jgi:hypothetical protein
MEQQHRRVTLTARYALLARRLDAVAALATHRTTAGAAKACGVGESTLRRWLKDPKFVRRVTAARSDVIEGALGKARDLLTRAFDAFDALLGSPNESIRLGAANGVIKAAGMVQDQCERDQLLNDITQRLADLESRRV